MLMEALRAFELVLALTPDIATSEEDVGVALLESGQVANAVEHMESALALDPLLLTAATELEEAYPGVDNNEQAESLARTIERMMSGK